VFSKAPGAQPVRAFFGTQSAFKKALSASDHLKVPSSPALCDITKNEKCTFFTINQIVPIYREYNMLKYVDDESSS
jgi:hypothetical protein